MHPSTIKLLSTTVAELPPIIDAHILDHLHGAPPAYKAQLLLNGNYE